MPSQLKNVELKPVIKALGQVVNDFSLPQHIRTCAEQINVIFSSSSTPIEQKKNKALQLLEEIVTDTNLDLASRTTLYSTISLIESINNEE